MARFDRRKPPMGSLNNLFSSAVCGRIFAIREELREIALTLFGKVTENDSVRGLGFVEGRGIFVKSECRQLGEIAHLPYVALWP